MADVGGEIVVEGTVEFDTARVQANARRVAQRVQQAFDRTLGSARKAASATDKLDTSLKKTGDTAERTRRRFQSFGGSLDEMEKGLITVAIAATQVGQTLTRVVTRPIIEKLKEGVTAVSDLEEVVNLSEVTFGKSSDAVVQWADDLDRAFGLTQKDAIESRSNFALLFTELGIGLKESSELSRELVERIGDIASLRNVPVPQVIQRIQSGLVGETEAVRRLGIILDESVIKREAVTQGIIAQGEALTAEQKVELRAQQILAQTTEAQGDALATADTFAGVLRQLRVVGDEFARSLGETIIPAVTLIGNIFIRVLDVVSKIPPTFSTLIVVGGLLVATLGPLLIILGQLSSIVLALRGAMAILAAQAGTTTTAFTGLSAAATRLGAILRVVAGPIGIIATAFLVVRQNAADADAAAKALIATVTQDIDTSSIEGTDFAVEALKDKLAELDKEADKAPSITDALNSLFLGPFGGRSQELQNLEEARKQIQDQIDEFEASGKRGERVLKAVGDATGATAAQIRAAADSIGISLGDIDQALTGTITERLGLEGLPPEIDLIVDEINRIAVVGLGPLNDALQETINVQEKLISLQDRVTAAQERVTAALQRVTDAEERVADAIQDVADAEERLLETRQRVIDLTQDLADLERERLDLINDTERDVRELAEAEEDLADARDRLIDLDEREADIRERINELQQPATARELADADRRIERAKIALNDARQRELDLLNELNQEQRESVDLSGLSLDQLRTRLAGLRAQTRSQRAALPAQRTQEEIEEDLVEARLDVEDATVRLNDALEDRNELDDKVINNAEEISRLERNLAGLHRDRSRALRDVGDAQENVNKLRAGETTRAKEIEAVDKRIVGLKGQILSATKDVETAERAVFSAANDVIRAQNNVMLATHNVYLQELNVLQAKRDQKHESILLLGSEREINQALRDRLSLNQAQLAGPNLIGNLADELIAGDVISSLFAGAASLPFLTGGAIPNRAFAEQVADLLLNNPNGLRALFRLHGVPGFEKGGLITAPTLARMGEHFKPEMILPMTNPSRVWSLLSQNLPKYPGALAAAQSAVLPKGAAKALSLGSGGRRAQNRDDGPMTYGQAKEIIHLLNENGKVNLTVDAPIQVTTPVQDPEFLARRVSQRIERNIIDKLRR